MNCHQSKVKLLSHGFDDVTEAIVPLMCVCFLCSGPGVRSGFPGMCSNRCLVHRSDAHRRPLLGVLSMLWQLRREDVPEANVLHSLSQKSSLLECVRHHSHYPVSVYVRL